MNWRQLSFTVTTLTVGLIFNLALIGCSPVNASQEGSPPGAQSEGLQLLALPELEAVDLNGEPLSVVATTSIIGDVVAQVGGEAIALMVLIGPGQDPHSYEPAARDLTVLVEADVIFVNGWDLEEGLVDDLVEISQAVPIVPISANIEPLAFGEDAHNHENETEVEHPHSGADPHVWFSIENVKQWVENLEQILSDLDPANAAAYQENAAAYQTELGALAAFSGAQVAQIPESKRFLVTNHNSLSYLADEFGFTILGTVIPAASTVAEPSAREIAGLIDEMEEHGVCNLFTEATVSGSLAQTIAAELDGCDQVQVLQLYTGALGPAGSGADSYIGMFRHNIETIVIGLR